MLKTDSCGFEYYEQLPENARPIRTIWPFITIDREAFDYYTVNIGMKYLIFAEDESKYYLNEITRYTKDYELLKYATRDQLFLLPLPLDS